MQTQASSPSSAVSRRQFIKNSSLAASAVAGASVLGGLTVERSAFAAGSDTLKIALIGCGGHGSGAAGQALSTTSCSVKLVAMADAFKDRLESSLNTLNEKYKDKVDVPPDRQ